MLEKVGILFGGESSEDSGPSDSSLHWPEPFTKLLPPAAQDENTNTSTIEIQTFTTKQIQNQYMEQQIQIYSNVKAHLKKQI